jgi:hypothetical protein
MTRRGRFLISHSITGLNNNWQNLAKRFDGSFDGDSGANTVATCPEYLRAVNTMRVRAARFEPLREN